MKVMILVTRHHTGAFELELYSLIFLQFIRYGGSLPSMTEANVQSKPISEIRNKKSKNIVLEVQDDKQFHTIRILLVFARDGAIHAEQIVTGMLNFSHEVFFHI